MLDSILKPVAEKQCAALAVKIAPSGLSANAITFFGLITAFIIFGTMGAGFYALAAILFLVNRLLDGLDGAVARLDNESSIFGYVFDRFSDIVTMGGIALMFAVIQPGTALAATFLIFALLLDTVSHFGIDILSKSYIPTRREADAARLQPIPGFYYMDKLVGDVEIALAFILMLLVPAYFPAIATIFAILLLITVVGRTMVTIKLSRQADHDENDLPPLR